jgi:hypothetical protein
VLCRAATLRQSYGEEVDSDGHGGDREQANDRLSNANHECS